MEDNKEKKYYWLKLNKDFFKQHEITVIEGMPNGKDYILFYLKLLCESLSHDGNLRFSDEIPYDDEMLANLTHTNIDIVRVAVRLFVKLHMMEIFDDGTMFMNRVMEITGSETEWAIKKRLYRDKRRQIEDIERTLSDKRIENRDKNITPLVSKDTIPPKGGSVSKKQVIPTLEEVADYCKERGNGIDPQAFIDYYASQKWKKANGQPLYDWKAGVRTWENKRKEQSAPKQRSNKMVEDLEERRRLNASIDPRTGEPIRREV